MQDPNDRHFVGAMFPEMFLDTFMNVTDLPAAPVASYSGVPDGGSVREVCKRLVYGARLLAVAVIDSFL